MNNNNIPTLNFDMISKILNIRMESKKDDRFKKNYDNFVKSFNEGRGYGICYRRHSKRLHGISHRSSISRYLYGLVE